MPDLPLPFGPDYGFGVYIHWPYCTRICPYCDFNVYAAKARDTELLFEAILADLAGQARTLPNHPPLNSIFFGGGTPSLMSPQQMERIVNVCETAFGLAPDCEITLEANPNNISKASTQDWKQVGIGRLSIGLQSLDERALTFLGRDHDSRDARRAVELAHSHFETFSIDMIYARPGQSLGDWEAELDAALNLGAPHLSLYELTIAPGTVFAKAQARGTLTPLPDTLQADMYELTNTLTRQAGLCVYEISNHAKSEADQSVHNLTYWRSGDWLGLGPGAHGRLSTKGVRTATQSVAKPDAYIKTVHEKGTGLLPIEILSQQDTISELITMGLRSTKGITQARVETLLDAPLSQEKLAYLRKGGWLSDQPGRLALTPAGRLLADRVGLELIS